jgi:polyphosphate glucokinase
VSVGFPGVVRGGVIRTAANLGDTRLRGFNLARALKKTLGAPVRVCNDADMQGLGAIRGKGVEMVITLGTGFGTSIFEDGRLGPHIELAHHPFHHDRTYEDELGDAALKEVGRRTWNRRLRRAIDTLRALTFFDHLYIGGGNSRLVRLKLPSDISIVDNAAGIIGGVRLWAGEKV